MEASDPMVLGEALARFELVLLEELGFGLDLESCAATGATTDLTHVSPKSGRAVSRVAAEPYLDKLFVLPAFLRSREKPTTADLRAAFRLTGHFLDEHVWRVRMIEMPSTRDAVVEALTA
jgi:DNA repair protein RecO (recombination protein O)